MTTHDDDLRRLLDRTAIVEVIHAYCDHVDRVDVDALVDLFTEDAVLDYGNSALFEGRAALRDLFGNRLGVDRATNHHCSTERVLAYDGTTAETVAYVYAFHEVLETGQHLHVWGRYEDSFRLDGDTWRISSRRIRVAGVETNDGQALPTRFERYERASTPTS
jgi:ketosteroid isomerase-like protein